MTGAHTMPEHWVGAVRVIGPGRAGGALLHVLRDGGWNVAEPIRHGEPVTDAANGVDLVVIATPDRAIAEVATRITPNDDALVLHLSGALGLDVLAPHPRVGAFHPLVSLVDAQRGAQRLVNGAWFGLSASCESDLGLLASLVEAMKGRWFTINDDQRTRYHGAATMASNHLVALMSQVERQCHELNIPFDAFVALAHGTLDNVAQTGAQRALTGPVARGDWDTVANHLTSLDQTDRPAYVAMARLAAQLVGNESSIPAWLCDEAQGRTTRDEPRERRPSHD